MRKLQRLQVGAATVRTVRGLGNQEVPALQRPVNSQDAKKQVRNQQHAAVHEVQENIHDDGNFGGKRVTPKGGGKA